MGTYQKKGKDPRFAIAHKEALIGIILAIFQFIWWYGFAFGLGSKPVQDYQFIFGFPAWFFFSCIVGFLVIIAIVIGLVKFVFKEVPLDTPMEGGEK